MAKKNVTDIYKISKYISSQIKTIEFELGDADNIITLSAKTIIPFDNYCSAVSELLNMIIRKSKDGKVYRDYRFDILAKSLVALKYFCGVDMLGDLKDDKKIRNAVNAALTLGHSGLLEVMEGIDMWRCIVDNSTSIASDIVSGKHEKSFSEALSTALGSLSGVIEGLSVDDLNSLLQNEGENF